MGLPVMTDFLGHPILGDDLEIVGALSAANSAQTVTIPSTPTNTLNLKRRLLQVFIHYSAGVAAQVTVTITITPGTGGAVTILSQVLAAGGQDVVFQPSAKMVLAIGDIIKVAAPAGGAGVTSAVNVYSEILGLDNRAAGVDTFI